MKTLENMPYSLSRAGAKNVDGVGNCEYLTQDASFVLSSKSDSCMLQTTSSFTPAMRQF